MHDLLKRLVSEGAAHFYADACELLQQRPPMWTVTHLVGHLVREVESATRHVFTSLPAATQLLGETVAKGDQTHIAEIEAVLRALSLESDHTARQWSSLAGRRGLHRTAHRNDLHLPRELDDEFLERFELFSSVLRVVLEAAEANYVTVLSTLDEVVRKAQPTKEDLDLLTLYLAPGVTALEHVFPFLSVGWLVPLRDRLVFNEPPDLFERDDGAIVSPTWPLGGFLERIAHESPREVATTIESVPLVNNENVHWCFLRAALRMPASEAARVSRHEIKWLSTHSWRGPISSAVQNLTAHLIGCGELATAVELLRVGLEIPPASTAEGADRGQLRLPSWDYTEMVEAGLPPLAIAAPRAAAALLFDLIDASTANLPYAWRAAIEDHRRNLTPTPFDSLVVALRDLYDARVKDDEQAMREAVAELEARQGDIYTRIALYLLGRHVGLADDLVVARATSQSLLDSSDLYHELAELIRQRFPHLSKPDQDSVVNALRENSSQRHVLDLYQYSADPDGRVERHAKSKRRKLFALLGDARPADVAAEYALLCAEEGEPKSPSFSSSVGELRIGPNSPLSASRLCALDDADLLEYLRGWKPAGSDSFEPSHNGLGLELRTCTRAAPARFSALARDFIGLHPRYVSSVLWGIHEAALNVSADPKPTIDWGSALELAAHAAQQTDAAGGDSSDWIWTRRTAADLVEDAAVAAIRSLDYPLIQKAWATLRILLNDADPAGTRASSSTKDYLTFAANTVRGQALQSTFAIAVALSNSGAAANVVMLVDVLEKIIERADATKEPSLAVRSVIAHNLNQLFLLDEQTAAATARMLFPIPLALDEQRWTMWNMFLESNGPSRKTLETLFDTYSCAVDAVATAPAKAGVKLGEHLVALAANSIIGPDTSDRLLMRFVKHAPAAVRRGALNHLGRMLWNDPGPLAEGVQQHLVALWTWWERTAQSAGNATDLAAFGWWFSSGLFDPAWLLSTLLRVLNVTGGELDWEHEVAETFAALAPSFPETVAECLQKFVEGRANARVYGCLDAIRATLLSLISGPAAAAARSIASRLVARGLPEFRQVAQTP